MAECLLAKTKSLYKISADDEMYGEAKDAKKATKSPYKKTAPQKKAAPKNVLAEEEGWTQEEECSKSQKGLTKDTTTERACTKKKDKNTTKKPAAEAKMHVE